MQKEKRKAQTAAAVQVQPRLLLETGGSRRGASASFRSASLDEMRALEPAPLAVAFAFVPLEKRGAQQGLALARGK